MVSDPWVVAIARWLPEHLSAARLTVPKEAEAAARRLLADRVGRFDKATLTEFFKLLNTDYFQGKQYRNRFRQDFAGAQVQRLAGELAWFNDWARQLWTATDKEVGGFLDHFWGGGPGGRPSRNKSLPTLFLYLRDPLRYNIWLDRNAGGLSAMTGRDFTVPNALDSAAYLAFNDGVNNIRQSYGLQPEEMDALLGLARDEAGSVLARR
ncbi:MAG: hypothetical protein ACYC4L_07170 [Chloroflexota bacterium]